MFQCLRRIKRKPILWFLKKILDILFEMVFCYYLWNGECIQRVAGLLLFLIFFFPGRERNSHDYTLDYNYAWHATGRVIFPFFSSLFFPTCFFLYSTLIFLSFCLLWLRWGKTNAKPSWHLCQTKTAMRKVSRTVKFRSTKLNKIILCRIYLQKNCLAPVKLII